MPSSKAVIIFNEKTENRDKLKTISNTFYRLNMTVCTLVNKTAEEIQEAVVQLSQMDPDEILDIIFVIHAEQVNEWDRKFSTVDRKIMDLYNNIINYLLEVEEFKDKPKIIIFKVCGRDVGDDLVPFNPDKEFRCVDYGSMSDIVWSNKDEFIDEFFNELAVNRSLSKTIENKSKFISNVISTSEDFKLKIPPANAELTSEFHEFIIG